MYESRITREHRTAIILLCDQSGSMEEEIPFRGKTVAKAEAVARILNELLEEFLNRSRRAEGVRDYFDLAVLGYSGDGVASLLSPAGEFFTVPDLARKPVRANRETVLRRLPSGNQVTASVNQKYWIEPRAEGDTPMGAALSAAERLVRSWCARTANRESFPPIVINITDGEASDADGRQLCELADKIRAAGTEDGNALLFNIHLAAVDSTAGHVSFPSAIEHIPPHRYARVLYDMSSVMPECYNDTILQLLPGARPPFRAMSFNCAVSELFSMLAIGSLSVSLTA